MDDISKDVNERENQIDPFVRTVFSIISSNLYML